MKSLEDYKKEIGLGMLFAMSSSNLDVAKITVKKVIPVVEEAINVYTHDQAYNLPHVLNLLEAVDLMLSLIDVISTLKVAEIVLNDPKSIS